VDLPYENVAKERREGRETVEKTRNLRSWEFEELGIFTSPHSQILKSSNSQFSTVKADLSLGTSSATRIKTGPPFSA
jgi:hypothetical protein